MAITLLLNRNNKSRRWLAAQLGKNDFWIGRRMNGASEFKIGELEQIAKLFGLGYADFFAVPDQVPMIEAVAL